MMLAKPIPAKLVRVVQKVNLTMLVIEAQDKEFAIYAETSVGEGIQDTLEEQIPLRPKTMDLLERTLTCFNIEVRGALLYRCDQGVCYVKLVLFQDGPETLFAEIDCRPSDAIQLCLRSGAELWITADALAAAPQLLTEDDQ